ncbi:unnamed protein product [Polarella glacialis]|uniref:Uncharacterized protein n=1 Tax=Polarella glacialis TaxID=89957 RepID=A0A813L2I8_POLGL|nr:unnamed protein product [Polarella glacialis]
MKRNWRRSTDAQSGRTKDWLETGSEGLAWNCSPGLKIRSATRSQAQAQEAKKMSLECRWQRGELQRPGQLHGPTCRLKLLLLLLLFLLLLVFVVVVVVGVLCAVASASRFACWGKQEGVRPGCVIFLFWAV